MENTNYRQCNHDLGMWVETQSTPDLTCVKCGVVVPENHNCVLLTGEILDISQANRALREYRNTLFPVYGNKQDPEVAKTMLSNHLAALNTSNTRGGR